MNLYSFSPAWVISVDDPVTGSNTPEFVVKGEYSLAVRVRDELLKELLRDDRYRDLGVQRILRRIEIRSTMVVEPGESVETT